MLSNLGDDGKLKNAITSLVTGKKDPAEAGPGTSSPHVWMPRLVQVNFQRLEHVIGCGHVSGLIVRLFTCRGPVW